MSFKKHLKEHLITPALVLPEAKDYEKEYLKSNPTGDKFHDEYADKDEGGKHIAEAGKHLDRAAHHWDHLSGDDTWFGEGEDHQSAHKRLTSNLKSAGTPKTQEQKDRLALMKHHLNKAGEHINAAGIKYGKKVKMTNEQKQPLHGTKNHERHEAWAKDLHLHKQWLDAMHNDDGGSIGPGGSKATAQYHAYHLGHHHATVTHEFGEGESHAMRKHSALYHSGMESAHIEAALHAAKSNIHGPKVVRLYTEKQ